MTEDREMATRSGSFRHKEARVAAGAYARYDGHLTPHINCPFKGILSRISVPHGLGHKDFA
jgi:hypothetical protein